MSAFAIWSTFMLSVVLIPPLCSGLIRKVKARLQGRIGAPIWQPFFELYRLSQKRETLSQTMCGFFRCSTAIGLSTTLTLTWLLPWISIKPWAPDADLFLVLYVMAFEKMVSMLGALDSGSPFAAFGATRGATLNLLVEPAFCLALLAIAIANGDTNINQIFLNRGIAGGAQAVYFFSGLALFFISLVELGRMPIDDPTTHLELTMVHEAMILEASAKNLLLLEYARILKMTLYWGLSTQCMFQLMPAFHKYSGLQQEFLSVCGIMTMACLVAVGESLLVKLQWRKIPEFAAYVMSLSIVSAFAALAGKRL